jgi:hypothetical protein
MTQLLEKVFAEVAKLPELEQNALAKWLLRELSTEREWEQAFAGSEEALEKLADEALNEHKKGKTKPLDPGRL